MSGLCQPTYVLDIPGGHGKSPVGPNYLEAEGERFSVEDFNGTRHAYPPRVRLISAGSRSRRARWPRPQGRRIQRR